MLILYATRDVPAVRPARALHAAGPRRLAQVMVAVLGISAHHHDAAAEKP